MGPPTSRSRPPRHTQCSPDQFHDVFNFCSFQVTKSSAALRYGASYSLAISAPALSAEARSGASTRNIRCLLRKREELLGVNATRQIACLVPGVYAVGVADPARTDADHLRRVEEELKQGTVKALKGYSGCLHYGPDSLGYAPYYGLAARYGVPFIFHTGDTYSSRAKVKFAHPLLVDEAAVDHPDVNFVMAHCGNPWLIDAAEVVYKNANVWADLSGLLVGDAADFDEMSQRGTLEKVARNVADAIDYSERLDRFLYGSDWPLAPMSSYRSFIEMIVPEEHRAAVFADNARELFRLPPA